MIVLALAMAAYAVTTTGQEITISNAEVKLYDSAETVTIVLNTPECYGIEGVWSTTATGNTNSISLTGLKTEFAITSADKLDVSTGKVIWVDYTFVTPVEGDIMTATYTIPADTPAGEYTVTFTLDVYTNGDLETVDDNVVYSTTIKVTRHTCSDAANDGDHICDDPLCGKDGVTEHSHGNYGKDDADHWSVCAECSQTIPGTTAPHDFTNGNCVCGANLVGDLDLDGDITSEDLTLLARVIAGIESLEGEALLNADVDGDDDVSSEDLTMHARYIAGIIDTWN